MTDDTVKKHSKLPFNYNHAKQDGVLEGGYITQIYDADGDIVAGLHWCGKYIGDGVTRSARDDNAKLIVNSVNQVQQYREALEATLKYIGAMQCGDISAIEALGEIQEVTIKALEDK